MLFAPHWECKRDGIDYSRVCNNQRWNCFLHSRSLYVSRNQTFLYHCWLMPCRITIHKRSWVRLWCQIGHCLSTSHCYDNKASHTRPLRHRACYLIVTNCTYRELLCEIYRLFRLAFFNKALRCISACRSCRSFVKNDKHMVISNYF